MVLSVVRKAEWRIAEDISRTRYSLDPVIPVDYVILEWCKGGAKGKTKGVRAHPLC